MGSVTTELEQGVKFLNAIQESVDSLALDTAVYRRTTAIGSPASSVQSKPEHPIRQFSSIEITKFKVLTKYVQLLISAAANMFEAAKNDDILQQAAYGNQIPSILAELWVLRDIREEEWGELVSFLQAALYEAVFEDFSIGQCELLVNLLIDYFKIGLLKETDIRAALKQFKEAGLDAWLGISLSDE
jgi:hypothetical protein